MSHHSLVLLAAFALTISACSGDDTTEPTGSSSAPLEAPAAAEDIVVNDLPSPVPTAVATDERSAAVFSFDDDELCDWITPGEMAEFVSGEYGWQGTVTSTEPVPDARGCIWHLSGGDPETSSVWVTEETDVTYDEIITYDEQTRSPLGTLVVGRPELSEDVGVMWGGFGWNAFGVPADDHFIGVHPLVPGDELDAGEAIYGLVNRILEALGWTT